MADHTKSADLAEGKVRPHAAKFQGPVVQARELFALETKIQHLEEHMADIIKSAEVKRPLLYEVREDTIVAGDRDSKHSRLGGQDVPVVAEQPRELGRALNVVRNFQRIREGCKIQQKRADARDARVDAREIRVDAREVRVDAREIRADARAAHHDGVEVSLHERKMELDKNWSDYYAAMKDVATKAVTASAATDIAASDTAAGCDGTQADYKSGVKKNMNDSTLNFLKKADSFGEVVEKMIYTPKRLKDLKECSKSNADTVKDTFSYLTVLAGGTVKLAKGCLQEMNKDRDDSTEDPPPFVWLLSMVTFLPGIGQVQLSILGATLGATTDRKFWSLVS